MTVHIRREGAIAYVTMDNPPMNAIDLSVRRGLEDALNWVAGEAGLSRVVLTGSGRTFATGADAREFDIAPVAPHLPDIVNRIETSQVPWVAAINGAALGGGCELLLACRFRIAGPGVQIGLPEVTLGVVPGAGGTHRLPRLIGLAPALDIIATGRPVSAEQAERLGLVDGLADDPVTVAALVDIGSLELAVPVTDRAAPVHDADVVDNARRLAARTTPHQTAPQKAIDLVELASRSSVFEGMQAEYACVDALRTTEQARALHHIFFAEQAAQPPASISTEAADLDQVAVIGDGTMGAGLAYALLNAGLRVCLLETDADGVARALDNFGKILAANLKRGLISEQTVRDLRSRFVATTDYTKVADVTLAIEAAFESVEVKTSIFKELEAHLAPGAVLATSTSHHDINQIARAVSDPSRVVGLHFPDPAHITNLLEIVRCDATGNQALATAFSLTGLLHKVPVLTGASNGFIGKRILTRYHEAADTVFMDGSTPWEIDEAMVEFGYAMGPYEAQDMTGLDVAYASRRLQDATREPGRRYIPIADRMVELGKLGHKTGAGWYRYPGGRGKVEDPIVADLALEESHFAGRARTDYSANQIRQRLLLAMINESADILHEGIARCARDIDLVTALGHGFPRFRGGLMHYADLLGAKHIVAQLDELALEDALVWRASPLLRHCAETGTLIRDLKP